MFMHHSIVRGAKSECKVTYFLSYKRYYCKMSWHYFIYFNYL